MDSIRKEGNSVDTDAFLKGMWQAVEEELGEIRKDLEMIE